MKILVRSANWIGDAVMSVPALRELRRAFPSDRITLHSRSWADGLFRDADFIDEIVTYDPARSRVRDILDNSRFLKADGHDVVILFPNSFESALTAALSRIPMRIGYNKDARGLLLTDPIAVPEWKNRAHEAFYYLELVKAAVRRITGREPLFAEEPDAHLDVAPERIEEARKFLASEGVDLARPVVALGVGSTNSLAKRWPAERYAKLAELLHSHASVLMLGSKAEADAAAKITELCNAPIVDLSGKTDLASAVAVLAACDAMVSNDMGLAHIAPSVGTRTFVIFGPTNPVTTRPFSPNAEVISHPVDCSPCMLRECPIDHRCMTGISPEFIFERVMNYLSIND
ncbi:MAG: lipopolysaccharide heptosyltransferase II [Acidobacteria bacterium OLB17]|nr:MAG: lipopolysaccharide heptosyltransferase II [Acidobacteria bacterium OLB17]MCZ2389660.1 lipopolysaccharide heptosyltransferase II [Acidobacteriota bacterium]